MPTASFQIGASLATIQASPAQTVVTDDVADIVIPASIPAAQPATLTTRTDNTHGTLTMTNSGHGITTGQRIDLYWSNGQTYDVTVGTVAGTSVPITLSTGTLPVATTPINAGIPVQRTIAITGNNLSAALFNNPNNVLAYVVPVAAGPTDSGPQLLQANGSYSWYTGNGITNPWAGVTLSSVWLSHNDTTAARSVQAGFLSH